MDYKSKLKIYLNIDNADEDDLLLFLIDLSKQRVLEKLYPFDSTKTEVPSRYEMKIIEIAVFLYNKRGAEGETSHGENGINRTYENADIPDSLMRGITPFVGSPIKIN